MSGNKIFVDTNILIYLLEGEQEIIEMLNEKELGFVTLVQAARARLHLPPSLLPLGATLRWLIIYVYLCMGTKEQIIAKINEIEYEKLLKEILSLINIESELGETYELTEEQKSAVNEGLNVFNNGR